MFKMIKDPVGGMVVDPAKAVATTEYKEKTYYFCTSNCKTAFEQRPEMTEQELAGLRAAIEGEPYQRRTMPLWWVKYWTRKGIQTLKKRYLGGKS
jgi:YHS domain-containing protein